MGITTEELAGLSDEERAALEDEDQSESASANDEDDQDEGSVESLPDTDSAYDDDDDADGDEDAGEDEEDDPEAVVPAEFRPEMVAPVVEGAADRISELDSRLDALVEQFRDGEIDMATFLSEQGKINDERMEIKLAESQAEFAKTQNEATRDQRWQWEQERFFSQKHTAIYKDPILRAALAASVKTLDADKANAGKPLAWFLEEADRKVRLLMAAKPRQPKTPNLSAVPKTLATMPAAELPETGGGEFAHLDKLDGLDLERALAKLSPEQEARYLRSAA